MTRYELIVLIIHRLADVTPREFYPLNGKLAHAVVDVLLDEPPEKAVHHEVYVGCRQGNKGIPWNEYIRRNFTKPKGCVSS
jgi:hypothetical protein